LKQELEAAVKNIENLKNVISDKVKHIVFLLFGRNPSTCSFIRRTSICKKRF
jgi:hypothetical protein